MKRNKQLLSLLLAGVMTLTMMPSMALAAGETNAEAAVYSASGDTQQRGYQAGGGGIL